MTDFEINAENRHLWKAFAPYEFILDEKNLGDTPSVEILNEWTIPYIGLGLGYDVDPIVMNVQSLTDIIRNYSFYKNPHVLERILEFSEESDPALSFIIRIILTPELYEVFIPDETKIFMANDDDADEYLQDMVERVDILYRGLVTPNFIELNIQYPKILIQMEAMIKYFGGDVPERDQWVKQEQGTDYYIFIHLYTESIVKNIDGKILFQYPYSITGTLHSDAILDRGWYSSSVLDAMGILFGFYMCISSAVVITATKVLRCVGGLLDVQIKEFICLFDEVQNIYYSYGGVTLIVAEPNCYCVSSQFTHKLLMPSKIVHVKTGHGAYELDIKIVFETVDGKTPVFIDKYSLMLPEDMVRVDTRDPHDLKITVLIDREWKAIGMWDNTGEQSIILRNLAYKYGGHRMWQ